MTAFAAIAYSDGFVLVEQKDPFAWIDPFAEIEEWASRAAEQKLDREEEIDRIRQYHDDEVRMLRAHIEAMQKAISDAVMFSPAAAYIPRVKP